MTFTKALFPVCFLVIGLFFSCEEPENPKTYINNTIDFNEDRQFHPDDSVAIPSKAQVRALYSTDSSIKGAFSPGHPAGVGGGITGRTRLVQERIQYG